MAYVFRRFPTKKPKEHLNAMILSFQTKGSNRQFFLVLLIDVDCILDYCVSENEYRDVLSLSALAYAALCLKSMLHMKSFSYLSGLCTSFGNVKDGVGWYVQRNAKTMR